MIQVHFMNFKRQYLTAVLESPSYTFKEEHLILGIYIDGVRYTLKDQLTEFEQMTCLTNFGAEIVDDNLFNSIGRKITLSDDILLKVAPCCEGNVIPATPIADHFPPENTGIYFAFTTSNFMPQPEDLNLGAVTFGDQDPRNTPSQWNITPQDNTSGIDVYFIADYGAPSSYPKDIYATSQSEQFAQAYAQVSAATTSNGEGQTPDNPFLIYLELNT